jgi:hypothetical protein
MTKRADTGKGGQDVVQDDINDPQEVAPFNEKLGNTLTAAGTHGLFSKDVPVTSHEAQPPSVVSSIGEQEEETYPEGGLQAWLVVLGSWTALFSSLGLMNSLATFQTYVAMNQLSSYNEGTIGWIFSIYAFLCFFLGIYIGPLFDKYGPRWLILTGSICNTASLMLLSVCTGKYTDSLMPASAFFFFFFGHPPVTHAY